MSASESKETAAAAASATAKAAATSLAEKQFTTSLQTVPKLLEAGFDNTDQALKRVAFANDWPSWIFDTTEAEPASSALTEKMKLDKRNAYLLIMNKCEGHQVAFALDLVVFENQSASFAYELRGWHELLATFRDVDDLFTLDYVFVV